MKIFKGTTIFSLFLLILLTIIACDQDKSSDAPDLSTTKEITSFKFESSNNPGLDYDALGVISGTSITVRISDPGNDKDVSNLIATFSYAGTSLTISNIAQESGLTGNDFTSSVEYTVTAENSATTVYTVTVILYDDVSTFDDLTLVAESYWNGDDDGSGYGDFFTFVSGDTTFTNYECLAYDSWESFSYSNTTDTTTAGSDNQYSAYTGSGVGGSANYAVSFTMTMWGQYPQIHFGANSGDQTRTVEGFFVTNTTYAALSMLNGDSFAKKFGGDDGTDPDWFLLTVYALDENYNKVESNKVEFYLADYSFTNSSEDYIIDKWTWVDLSSLGEVYGLEFELTSSDTGAYGMNTPSYFAMDDLIVSDSE